MRSWATVPPFGVKWTSSTLQAQRDASAKSALFISDFVADAGPGRMTLDPPPAPGISAAGVRVILLVALPRDEYLGALQLSAAILFHTVEVNYRRHFEALGAEEITIQLLDSVPFNGPTRVATPPESEQR